MEGAPGSCGRKGNVQPATGFQSGAVNASACSSFSATTVLPSLLTSNVSAANDKGRWSVVVCPSFKRRFRRTDGRRPRFSDESNGLAPGGAGEPNGLPPGGAGLAAGGLAMVFSSSDQSPSVAHATVLAGKGNACRR